MQRLHMSSGDRSVRHYKDAAGAALDVLVPAHLGYVEPALTLQEVQFNGFTKIVAQLRWDELRIEIHIDLAERLQMVRALEVTWGDLRIDLASNRCPPQANNGEPTVEPDRIRQLRQHIQVMVLAEALRRKLTS